MTVSEALLNCISAALDGRECALTLAPDDWTVLLRAGFVLTEPERDYRSAHEARYVHPDTGLVVEGHWALFPTEYAVYAALNMQLPDLMQRAQDWETGGVTLRVPDVCDHLIFLLLHAFKHFISSGVGVRQLCDIALWMRRFGAQIDWQRVRAALRATHSEGFAAAVIDAGAHRSVRRSFPGAR